MSKSQRAPARRKKAAPARKSRSYYAYKQDQNYYKRKAANNAKPPGIMSVMGGELGALAGSAIPVIGAPIGRFLGGKLGHLAEKVTGFGDYKVEGNSILKGGMSPPQIVNSVETGSTIVRHREYLGDISASVAFVNRQFVINPGMPNTFPWLSQIANSYEQYRLRGVLFEFNSTSSDAILSGSTSSALGTVTMQTDYDVADAPPSSKRQMLNSLFSSSSKPSCSFIHPIECKKSLSAQSILYTRGSNVPNGFDPRLYDFANFNIATEGQQAVNGGVLGELWITYEIELFKQQFSYLGLADHYQFTNMSTARPLGTVAGSNLGRGGTIGGLINGAGTAYSFPPTMSSGKYFVSYSVVGTGAAASTVSPSYTLQNASNITYFVNATTAQVFAPAATTNTMARVFTLEITGQNAAIIFAADGSPGGSPAFGDFWVMRLPDSITP